MEFELKPVTRDGVPAAMAKAERYRLLNEPWEAESICRDVLLADPGNQQAVVMLLLAITDQFEDEPGSTVQAARALLLDLRSEYERAYYAGIICERWAKRLLRRNLPGGGPAVYGWLREAMTWYEQAEKLRPPGEDKSLLRWNTCARLIMKHAHLRPAPAEERAGLELE